MGTAKMIRVFETPKLSRERFRVKGLGFENKVTLEELEPSHTHKETLQCTLQPFHGNLIEAMATQKMSLLAADIGSLSGCLLRPARQLTGC